MIQGQTHAGCVALALLFLASHSAGCMSEHFRSSPEAPTGTPAIEAIADDSEPTAIASNFAPIGEFVGYVDPVRGVFDVRMVSAVEDAGSVQEDLVARHRALTTTEPTGWCRALVERDGVEGAGRANTVELYTPWGEIDKTIPDCLERIGDDALTEVSFPNGVLCADVTVRSFYSTRLDDVYAEITSHNGSSNQYGYAFPLGNGAARPEFGRNRPGLDLGLWAYGSLGPADGHVGEPLGDPPDEKTVTWTFKYGSTTPFTFSGRLVYSVAEDCDNGVDDDCDGIADNACSEFLVDNACIIDADCAGDSFCDGGALGTGDGDTDGVCKCNTADPAYHDDACSATCADGEKNGSEEEIDCGGPCDPCGPTESILTPQTLVPSQTFGASVSLSDDRLVVGGPGSSVAPSGRVEVFERAPDSSWALAAELTPSPATLGAQFGGSVDHSGDRIIVGAYADASAGSSTRTGEAYIFERQPDDSWDQAAELNPGVGNGFGTSVAIDGDLAVVGMYDGSTTSYVWAFRRDAGGSWRLDGVVASASDSHLGIAVDVAGDRILASDTKAVISGVDSGAAYVYEPSASGIWEQVATLASGRSEPGSLGYNVALDASGERAVVGDLFEDDHGAAYVFDRQSDGSWARSARLVPSVTDGDVVSPSTGTGPNFASALAISGDRIVSGAGMDDLNEVDSGSAYLFERQTDGSWAELLRFSGSGAGAGDGFGRETLRIGPAVGISATEVAVGASLSSVETSTGSVRDGVGVVYVFADF